mgnify:CR=1 FL=1
MVLIKVSFILNGKHAEAYTKPNRTLCDFLHDEMRMTSVKKGCGTGNCGSCTVIMDGKPVTSCTMLSPQANGREIMTLEGLGTPEKPHPIQAAFVRLNAIQCGFCIPGMMLTTACLLKDNPNPSDEDIKRALGGNLCRCTGYIDQIQAIKEAARLMNSNEKRVT